MKTAYLERYFSTSEIDLILVTARTGFELMDMNEAGIVQLVEDKDWTDAPAEAYIKNVAGKLGKLTEMLGLED